MLNDVCALSAGAATRTAAKARAARDIRRMVFLLKCGLMLRGVIRAYQDNFPARFATRSDGAKGPSRIGTSYLSIAQKIPGSNSWPQRAILHLIHWHDAVSHNYPCLQE